MDEPKNHHFIPKFYLKRWTTHPEGEQSPKLWQFSRSPLGKLLAGRKTTTQTGYGKFLYRMEGLPEHEQNVLENELFQFTDDRADKSLAAMFQVGPGGLDREQRSSWSRFLLSLLHRSPEKMTWLRAEMREQLALHMAGIQRRYAEVRRPDDPQTFEGMLERLGPGRDDYAAAWLLWSMVDNEQVGGYLNGMIWLVVDVELGKHSLLTSDRPIVMSDGIRYDHSFIMLALSPCRLFIATKTRDFMTHLLSRSATKLVAFYNKQVVMQAQQFGYAHDLSQRAFLERWHLQGGVQFVAPGWPRWVARTSGLPGQRASPSHG